MFTYDEFKVKLEEAIKEYLGDDGVVEYITNLKNNGTQKEAFVLKGSDSKVSPCIYPNAMYNDYMDGISMNEILEIIKMVFEDRGNIYDELFFDDWNNVKRLVTVAVINTEWNKECLKKLCHREFLNLSIICKCIVHEDEHKRASFNITHEHMKNWGITEEELWKVARDNLREEQFLVKDLHKMLSMVDGEERMDSNYLFVLTNKNNKDGAKVILCSDYFKKLADKLNSDLFIIPSSIHEVLCLPVDEERTVEEINRMIQEVNYMQLEVEDRLADNVYLYSRENGEVTIAQ